MSKNTFKDELIKAKIKNSFLTLNVHNSSLHSKFKNLKKRFIPIEAKQRSINSSYIIKNKNKLIIPKILQTINIERNRSIKKNENLKRFSSLKLKILGNNIIHSNYFDINNNNYYVNLCNTSTPKLIKSTNVAKKNIIKDKKNSVNKIKYINLTNYKKEINFQNRTLTYEKKQLFEQKNTIELDIKMKNYRNKLLLEFMKHLKRFVGFYKKKYFTYFMSQLRNNKTKKIFTNYIYKKKIKQIPIKNDRNKYITYNNSYKKISKTNINNKTNKKYLTLSKINGKIIINKIKKSPTKDVINGGIRNVFLYPYFLNNNKNLTEKKLINNFIRNEQKNYNKGKIVSADKNKNKNNVLEIKINFKNSKDISINRSKINIRTNYFLYKYFNKNDIKYYFSNLKIQKFVDNFYLLHENKKISDIKRNLINKKRKNRILSSIIEVEEKINGTYQDLKK